MPQLALTDGAIYPVEDGARSSAEAIAISTTCHLCHTDASRRLHRPADESRAAQGPHGGAGHPGRAHPPDQRRHRGIGCNLNGQPPPRSTSRPIKAYAGGASRRALDPRRRLADVGLRSGRQPFAQADRCGRARPPGYPHSRDGHTPGSTARRSKLAGITTAPRTRSTGASIATRRPASRRQPAGRRKPASSPPRHLPDVDARKRIEGLKYTIAC